MRIIAETAVGVLFTFVLTWLILGVLGSIDNPDPAGVLFSDAPSLMFGAFWIALALWVLLVILGNVLHRRRRPGARVLHNLLAALVAALVNVVVFTVIGISAGGWGVLLVGIVLGVAIAFLVAAAIAIPLTHLVFFRPRTGTGTGTGAGAPAPAAATTS